MKQFQNFIGGQYREALSEARMDIFDPTTGLPYATAAVSSADDVALAYETAEKAFETWGESTPA